MISALRHGPVGRTYEEDDEDEQALQFVDPVGSLELILTAEISNISRLSTILYALDIAAKPISNVVIESGSFQNVGFVKASGNKNQIATIYHSNVSNALVVVLPNKLENQIASALAGVFDKFEASSVIILDSLSIANYTGLGNESSLRKVTSSTFTSHAPFGGAKALSILNLEIGNLITGLAAALLSHAEARQIPAAAFVVLSKVFLSVPSMKAFEALAPLLQELLGETVEIPLPTNAAYNELLRRDPYVLRTENLYS